MKHCIIITFLVTVLLSGCTTNNGDIGPWYGSWQLYQIEIDNIPDNNYSANVFWAFQSSIIKMTVLNSKHQTDEYWGTWNESDGVLTLKYTHSNAETPPGHNEYSFPPNIYLPSNGTVQLRIIEQKSNRLSLEYTKTDGIKVLYRLQKQI